MPAIQWFIAQEGRRTGPFPADQLPELAKQGALTPRSLVWRKGLPAWKPAQDVPELESVFAGPGPAGTPDPPAAPAPEAPAAGSAPPPAAPAPGSKTKTAAPRPGPRRASPRSARGELTGAGQAPRRPAPAVPAISSKEKRVRLVLIFASFVTIVGGGGWLAWRYFNPSVKTKKVVIDLAQKWERAVEKARAGTLKIAACFEMVRGGDGALPAADKAKFDADLAQGKKIVEDHLKELVALRLELKGEGPQEYDRDLYVLRKDLTLAARLADETDRRLTLEFPRRSQELLRALQKFHEDFQAKRDSLTPESRKPLADQLQKLQGEIVSVAEQWGALLEKYKVENKTSETPDPEDTQINRLIEANKNARMMLMELR